MQDFIMVIVWRGIRLCAYYLTYNTPLDIFSATRLFHEWKHFWVTIRYNGKCRWQPGGNFAFTCALDMNLYPFDEQSCTMEIETWFYTADKVQLTKTKDEFGLETYLQVKYSTYIVRLCVYSSAHLLMIFFVSGRSLPELFNVLQNEIVKIREWLNNNKLSLNISKTNYMIMTNRKKVQQNDDFQLSIDGQTISQVNETKFLGVIIDDRMTFKSHINHIAGKMSKGVGIICKARKLSFSSSVFSA